MYVRIAALRVVGPSSAWFLTAFAKMSRASSSRSLAWSMELDAGDWGRGSSSSASCALGRLVGISIMDSGRHASKNRIPGRGVTSLYGPVRSSGLPLRALKRPDGRQTYGKICLPRIRTK